MKGRDSLKAAMRAGKPVFGTFVKNYCPNIVEMLGFSGFDFAIIDCEHSAFSYSEAENLIRACEVSDLASIVRIAEPAAHHVHHAMESGATGVQVPSIVTVEQAADCAAETAFFPDGRRSPNPALRAGRFGCWSGETSYIASKSASSLCVVQVESFDMAGRVEELCEIPQIDVLFVGPGDLSASMGKPGKLGDPEVITLIDDIIRRGLAGGKLMGMLCSNAASVKKYVDMGVSYIAYSSDSGIISSAFKGLNQDLFTVYR